MLQNNVAPHIGQILSSNQWPIILCAGLYATYRGDWVLVVIRFNATFLPLRSYWEKICSLPLSWKMQKVQRRMVERFDSVKFFLYPSLFFEYYNRILLCDWVLGRYSVCLRSCACRNTFVLYLALIRPGFIVLFWMYSVTTSVTR